MPEPAPLLAEHPREGVLRLTINDPERRNPLSTAVFDAIVRALAGASPDTRAVVLTGAGEAVFASGADLSELSQGLGGDFGAAMEAAQLAIEDCPAPVVARIQGHCLGAGYQLALACDLRVAADDATIGVPASRFGLLPGRVHQARMIQQLGPQATRELMLTGRSFKGDEALRRGLVDYTCPRAELDAVVDGVVDDIVAGAPITVRNAKRIINTLLRQTEVDAETASELDRLSEEAHASEDVREGLRAFFERRAPRFTGH